MEQLNIDSLELEDLDIEDIEIDYNPIEVDKIIKKQETETIEEKISNLEKEMIDSLRNLRERVDELDLPLELGKVRGDSNFFCRHKNGLKVYGETVYQNVHLLKELDGTWNPEMKCWFFPYNRKGNLIKMGMVERSETETEQRDGDG